MNILSQPVLVLNRSWQAINVRTVQEALSMMSADAATGMDCSSDGNFIPVKWSAWLELPVRETDDCIRTPNKAIRAPRVIIAVKFNKVPLKRPRLTMKNLVERDGNKCAYTQKTLRPSERSMEHVVPRSKGGETVWRNVVLAHKDVNNLRGNKTLKDAGLRLNVIPKEPKALPFHKTVKSAFPEWACFIKK